MIAGLAALCTIGSVARANADEWIEVEGTNRDATLDVKLTNPLGNGFGYFARHRSTVDYENQYNPFTVADLTFGLVGGVDAVAEGQFTLMGFDPRFGLQAYTKLGGLSLYGLITANRDQNAEAIIDAKYTAPIDENITLFSEVEAVANGSKEGLAFTIQRGRLGVGVNGFEFAAAVDCTETGDNLEPDCVYGIAIRK